MKQVKLQRIYQPDCTVGVLSSGSLRCMTLELPDLNNTAYVSCIPEGKYRVTKIQSPSLGLCFNIHDVLARNYIRIHSGNYTTQIEGCVLVGDSLKDINNDGVIDVTNSKNTLKKLLDSLPDEFELTITGT